MELNLEQFWDEFNDATLRHMTHSQDMKKQEALEIAN